jgi:hypothetical protein
MKVGTVADSTCIRGSPIMGICLTDLIAAAPLEKQRDASRSPSHNQNRLNYHIKIYLGSNEVCFSSKLSYFCCPRQS